MARFLIATSYGETTVSRYYFALASELHRRGHSVTVIVDGHAKVPPEAFPFSVLVWLSRRPTKLRDFRFLAAWLKQNPTDCMISNFGSTNVCQLVGWWQRIPTRIAWYHTLTGQIDADNPAPRWILRLFRWRKSCVYRCVTHFVANSHASSHDLQNAYRVPVSKCTILPLLLAPPSVSTVGKQANLIVCVGRLDASKGQSTLIRALPTILKTCPEARLELIGDGAERANYETLARSLGIESACNFMGRLPLSAVLERMATAAVCVAPSRSEALGLVNIEAQSVGTPVVASAVGGIHDVVCDGETGYLVSPDDPQAFAEKILALLTDETQRTAFGQNARRHFAHTFSLCNIGHHADTIEAMTAPTRKGKEDQN